jgi:L-alanine-DL-glutamate epimerase-like enolase superfamily enzyme
MELHVSLVCAVPNGRWVEYIPQLDEITELPLVIADGKALAPTEPGLGICWDWAEVNRRKVNAHTAVIQR